MGGRRPGLSLQGSVVLYLLVTIDMEEEFDCQSPFSSQNIRSRLRWQWSKTALHQKYAGLYSQAVFLARPHEIEHLVVFISRGVTESRRGSIHG